MKFYFQNHCLFEQITSFNEENRKFENFDKSNLLEQPLISGVGEYLGTEFVGFICKDQSVFLIIRCKFVDICQVENIQLIKNEQDRKLIISYKENKKSDFEYSVCPHIEDDYLSSFTHEEDFDFGLFLFNIFYDKKRLRRIIDAYSI